MPSLRTPLSRIICLVALGATGLISQRAYAETVLVDGDEYAIDETADPIDKYRVINGGKLSASGAALTSIFTTDSEVILNGSTINSVGSDAAFRSENSTGTINNSFINSERLGLWVASASTGGSNVTVLNSTVTAVELAATIDSESRLDIVNTTLVATGVDSIALEVFDGKFTATNSSITGALNGILVTDVYNVVDALVTLDGTSVVGQGGSAIVVKNFGLGTQHAHINVLNGSTLSGANGVLLEVVDTATATLTVGNSHLVGDVVAEQGATAHVILDDQATLTGRLDNISSLAINNQAQWIMVENGTVADLSMNGGSIKFGEPSDYYTLSVGNLSGNGTFHMASDFSTGDTDFLDVTGTATGNHELLVSSSGADPLTPDKLYLVHTAAGDAQFSLVNDRVDVGAYSYELASTVTGGETDWYLNPESKVISPGTESVMALFNAAPTVWYGELTTLRSRMGEVRMDGGQPGMWVRAYGNKYAVSAASGLGYTQNQQGLSFGADARLPVGDGQWLVGLLAGYSKSDLDMARGTTGTVDSYYAGAYTTWLDAQTGYYFDGVVKVNRFQNKSSVSLSDNTTSKGSYNNYGVGVSAEVGRHIKLDDGYFVEPYAQLASVAVQGKNYELDNGMQAEGDRTRSLLAKVGSTVGRNFTLVDGKVVQPYVRAAYVHEFVKTNEVRVNDNVFNNDLSGSRGELGAGLSVSMSDKLSVHVDVDYSNGDSIEQPWGAALGVRYSW